ncbi:MAG TPA: alpha/beta fold hydrolase [Vicinamibacteria bacterium]|nr:alpha/beta fold hydrolase [Vicinamibacteria bacterium]
MTNEIQRLKTNVRAFIAKLCLRPISRLAPDLAAHWLERLFLATRRHRVPDREARWLASAERSRFRSRGLDLATWTWGDGPAVLLAHGWEGRGSQLGAFVEPLVRAGFRVVTFDAPGHGASPLSQSSLVEMADAVVDAATHLGPFAGVIAHSAGAAATTIALDRGATVGRAVFIAPPTDLGAFLRYVADHLGLHEGVADRTQRRIENRFGVSWDSLRLDEIAPRMMTPILVIHDRDDREVGLENGLRLADLWPEAELVVTSGLGHRRILRADEVIARATEFLEKTRVDPFVASSLSLA